MTTKEAKIEDTAFGEGKKSSFQLKTKLNFSQIDRQLEIGSTITNNVKSFRKTLKRAHEKYKKKELARVQERDDLETIVVNRTNGFPDRISELAQIMQMFASPPDIPRDNTAFETKLTSKFQEQALPPSTRKVFSKDHSLQKAFRLMLTEEHKKYKKYKAKMKRIKIVGYTILAGVGAIAFFGVMYWTAPMILNWMIMQGTPTTTILGFLDTTGHFSQKELNAFGNRIKKLYADKDDISFTENVGNLVNEFLGVNDVTEESLLDKFLADKYPTVSAALGVGKTLLPGWRYAVDVVMFAKLTYQTMKDVQNPSVGVQKIAQKKLKDIISGRSVTGALRDFNGAWIGGIAGETVGGFLNMTATQLQQTGLYWVIDQVNFFQDPASVTEATDEMINTMNKTSKKRHKLYEKRLNLIREGVSLDMLEQMVELKEDDNIKPTNTFLKEIYENKDIITIGSVGVIGAAASTTMATYFIASSPQSAYNILFKGNLIATEFRYQINELWRPLANDTILPFIIKQKAYITLIQKLSSSPYSYLGGGMLYTLVNVPPGPNRIAIASAIAFVSLVYKERGYTKSFFERIPYFNRVNNFIHKKQFGQHSLTSLTQLLSAQLMNALTTSTIQSNLIGLPNAIINLKPEQIVEFSMNFMSNLKELGLTNVLRLLVDSGIEMLQTVLWASLPKNKEVQLGLEDKLVGTVHERNFESYESGWPENLPKPNFVQIIENVLGDLNHPTKGYIRAIHRGKAFFGDAIDHQKFGYETIQDMPYAEKKLPNQWLHARNLIIDTQSISQSGANLCDNIESAKRNPQVMFLNEAIKALTGNTSYKRSVTLVGSNIKCWKEIFAGTESGINVVSQFDQEVTPDTFVVTNKKRNPKLWEKYKEQGDSLDNLTEGNILVHYHNKMRAQHLTSLKQLYRPFTKCIMMEGKQRCFDFYKDIKTDIDAYVLKSAIDTIPPDIKDKVNLGALMKNERIRTMLQQYADKISELQIQREGIANNQQQLTFETNKSFMPLDLIYTLFLNDNTYDTLLFEGDAVMEGISSMFSEWKKENLGIVDQKFSSNMSHYFKFMTDFINSEWKCGLTQSSEPTKLCKMLKDSGYDHNQIMSKMWEFLRTDITTKIERQIKKDPANVQNLNFIKSHIDYIEQMRIDDPVMFGQNLLDIIGVSDEVKERNNNNYKYLVQSCVFLTGFKFGKSTTTDRVCNFLKTKQDYISALGEYEYSLKFGDDFIKAAIGDNLHSGMAAYVKQMEKSPFSKIYFDIYPEEQKHFEQLLNANQKLERLRLLASKEHSDDDIDKSVYWEDIKATFKEMKSAMTQFYNTNAFSKWQGNFQMQSHMLYQTNTKKNKAALSQLDNVTALLYEKFYETLQHKDILTDQRFVDSSQQFLKQQSSSVDQPNSPVQSAMVAHQEVQGATQQERSSITAAEQQKVSQQLAQQESKAREQKKMESEAQEVKEDVMETVEEVIMEQELLMQKLSEQLMNALQFFSGLDPSSNFDGSGKDLRDALKDLDETLKDLEGKDFKNPFGSPDLMSRCLELKNAWHYDEELGTIIMDDQTIDKGEVMACAFKPLINVGVDLLDDINKLCDKLPPGTDKIPGVGPAIKAVCGALALKDYGFVYFADKLLSNFEKEVMKKDEEGKYVFAECIYEKEDEPNVKYLNQNCPLGNVQLHMDRMMLRLLSSSKTFKSLTDDCKWTDSVLKQVACVAAGKGGVNLKERFHHLNISTKSLKGNKGNLYEDTILDTGSAMSTLSNVDGFFSLLYNSPQLFQNRAFRTLLFGDADNSQARFDLDEILKWGNGLEEARKHCEKNDDKCTEAIKTKYGRYLENDAGKWTILWDLFRQRNYDLIYEGALKKARETVTFEKPKELTMKIDELKRKKHKWAIKEKTDAWISLCDNPLTYGDGRLTGDCFIEIDLKKAPTQEVDIGSFLDDIGNMLPLIESLSPDLSKEEQLPQFWVQLIKKAYSEIPRENRRYPKKVSATINKAIYKFLVDKNIEKENAKNILGAEEIKSAISNITQHLTQKKKDVGTFSDDIKDIVQVIKVTSPQPFKQNIEVFQDIVGSPKNWMNTLYKTFIQMPKEAKENVYQISENLRTATLKSLVDAGLNDMEANNVVDYLESQNAFSFNRISSIFTQTLKPYMMKLEKGGDERMLLDSVFKDESDRQQFLEFAKRNAYYYIPSWFTGNGKIYTKQNTIEPEFGNLVMHDGIRDGQLNVLPPILGKLPSKFRRTISIYYEKVPNQNYWRLKPNRAITAIEKVVNIGSLEHTKWAYPASKQHPLFISKTGNIREQDSDFRDLQYFTVAN